MGKKIFVSYKYGDSDVEQLNRYSYSINTARNYVDKLQDIIGDIDIYKGEEDGNDLSKFKNETIWSKLKEKIYDSSVTVVLVSPNMKEYGKSESDQWIPQEISYSLKKIGRDNRTSQTNALIFVVLPNRHSSYDYFINHNYFLGGSTYRKEVIFDIMNKNLFNNKYNNNSYAVVAKWSDFVRNYSYYIDRAVANQERISDYNICKVI